MHTHKTESSLRINNRRKENSITKITKANKRKKYLPLESKMEMIARLEQMKTSM